MIKPPTHERDRPTSGDVTFLRGLLTGRVTRPHVALACDLGRDRRARLKIFTLYLIFEVRAKLGLGRTRPHPVRLHLGDRAIDWWVADRGDFALLVSIFILGEYDGPLPPRADLVLDLGAHVGTSVVFWRQRYPKAEIIAVEPDPESFRRLSRHLSDDPGVRLVHAAVTDRSGPVRFAPSRLGWTSHLAREDEGGVVVDGLSFPDLIERVSPGRTIDLLKVDIEGAESNVLKSPLSSVSTIVIETHNDHGTRAEDASLGEIASREGMREVKTAVDSVSWLVRDR
jgi:FkbM family methyltransferase